MKAVILTAAYGRWDIVNIFSAGIDRLRDSNICGIEVVMVGSEPGVSDRYATGQGYTYVETPNFPLGAKWNAGLAACRELEPDFVLALGSDDICSDSYLSAVCNRMETFDYAAALDCYFFDYIQKRAVHWPGYTQRNRRGEPIGAGKAFSRKLLDKIDWSLWASDQNGSLDYSAEQHLKAVDYKRGPLINCGAHGHLLMDIKNTQSLTKMDKVVGRTCQPEEINTYLSDKEIKLLWQ